MLVSQTPDASFRAQERHGRNPFRCDLSGRPDHTGFGSFRQDHAPMFAFGFIFNDGQYVHNLFRGMASHGDTL